MHETMDETADTMAVASASASRPARRWTGAERYRTAHPDQPVDSAAGSTMAISIACRPASTRVPTSARSPRPSGSTPPRSSPASSNSCPRAPSWRRRPSLRRGPSRVSPEWLRTAAAAVTDAALLSVDVRAGARRDCGRMRPATRRPARAGLPALLVMVVLLTTIVLRRLCRRRGSDAGHAGLRSGPLLRRQVPSGCRSSRSVRGACSSPRHRSAWSWHRAARRRAT